LKYLSFIKVSFIALVVLDEKAALNQSSNVLIEMFFQSSLVISLSLNTLHEICANANIGKFLPFFDL
jgi:hypothetical protein